MVGLGIIASQQVLVSLTRSQESRLRELVRLHVDGLSIALGPAVLREDVWEVFDTLDRASRAGEGRRMVMTAVADSEGLILAATDPRNAPLGSPLSALAASARTLEDLEVHAGDERISVLAPLSYQGREVGKIVTVLDVSDLAAEQRRTQLWLLLGNVASTLLLALAGYVAMRRMLRPISTLAGHMSAGTGGLELIPEREIPRGDSEVGRLLRTYNSMARAVHEQAEAKRRLAERERFVSLGRLASSLAHEINNPLGGLLNAVDTIARFADRPEVVRKSADLLQRGLGHLRDVSRAALEQNRLDTSDMPLRAEDFEDLQLLMGPEIQRQQQELAWEVEAGPACLDGLPAAPVRQIALNLLLNASAAAARGGHVGMSVRRAGDALELVVEDDGPGLPPKALARLLSPEPTGPGPGMGLRVVRDLVAALGGRIEHRRENAVTVIAVRLPVPGRRDAA
ncbi:MAG: sensor histidine kinase [Alphaproteobacteria bacterium]|nr:MAG: sensor histidine kinase [Alphaproteobacteria bacterium]